MTTNKQNVYIEQSMQRLFSLNGLILDEGGEPRKEDSEVLIIERKPWGQFRKQPKGVIENAAARKPPHLARYRD